jgi:hypothetical protein
MRHPSSLLSFYGILAAALAFVLLSGNALPPQVASHFRAGGGADGYMPRSLYLALMAGLTTGLPMLIVFLQGLVRFIPLKFINLPHRDYWLAPARRNATIDFIARQGVSFGGLLAAFLGFVHGLVVLANQRQPPHFSVSLLVAGLVAFLAIIAFFIGKAFMHFRRPEN